MGDKLDELLGRCNRLGIDIDMKIDKLRSDIRTSLAAADAVNHSIKLPVELPDWISKLHRETLSLRKQIVVVSSLNYSRILERERDIKEPHSTTCDWLFQDSTRQDGQQSSTNMHEWLRTGENVFWISGKAGSGKSTLMKHLYHSKSTHKALQNWAAGNDLVTAGFFFWSAGTNMQKNQQGLLQSLLMCILKKRPALVAHLCPERWNADSESSEENLWSRRELLDAPARLKTEVLGSVRFCFFIDGMDEYEGDHMEVLHTIEKLTKSGCIKACVSSRPWVVFESFYGANEGRKIVLQDLNRGDIWRFTHDNILEALQRRSTLVTRAECLNLIEEIADRSSSVFLWVFLVVRSLIRGMTNLDTVEELQARLRELPLELEEMFKRILDRADRVYGNQAARLYLIQLEGTNDGLEPIDIAHFAEEDLYFALSNSVASRHAKMVKDLDKITQRRVLARCQDLLEFSSSGVLQFLHRTVKDFLETRDIFDDLKRRAGRGFDPNLFMCNSTVVQVQAISHHLARARHNRRQYWQAPVSVEPIMYKFWMHAHRLALVDRVPIALISVLQQIGYTLDVTYPGDLEVRIIKVQIIERNICKGCLGVNCKIRSALVGRLATINRSFTRRLNLGEGNCDSTTVWDRYYNFLRKLVDSDLHQVQLDRLFALLRSEADLGIILESLSGNSLPGVVEDAPSNSETVLSNPSHPSLEHYPTKQDPSLPLWRKRRFSSTVDFGNGSEKEAETATSFDQNSSKRHKTTALCV